MTKLVFPHLQSGATVQYPNSKSNLFPTVFNLQEDGFRYWAEPTDSSLRWRLNFAGLSALEASTLRTFFEVTQGKLKDFLFLDPSGNLLTWSEDVTRPNWLKAPLTAASSAVGTNSVVHTFGGGPGNVCAITQTLAVPANSLICASLKARASAPIVLKLLVTDSVVESYVSVTLTDTWKGVTVAHQGSGSGQEKSVQISLPLGGTADISELMVSPQPFPAVYVPTREGSGIHQETRFDQDDLVLTASDKDEYSCQIFVTARR